MQNVSLQTDDEAVDIYTKIRTIEISTAGGNLNNLIPKDYRYIIWCRFSSSISNIPPVSSGACICAEFDANNVYQLAITAGAGVFARHKSFGTWTSWIEK